MTHFITNGKMTDFRLKSILVVLAALVVTLTAAYILTEGSEDVSAETTNSSDNDYWPFTF